MDQLRISTPAPPAAVPPREASNSRIVSVRILAVVVGALVLLLLWTALASTTSSDILPGPGAVWSRFIQSVQDGTYFPALLTTGGEAGAGWLIGLVIAIPIGYLVGRFRTLEDALAPYLAGSQAMPVVALAPLLVVWLGFGWAPKVTICALIAFFPILATTANGVRGVPRDLVDAARAFGAGAVPLATHIYLPLASRAIFAGVKVAAALSVTGAVVGEFINPGQGLGAMILSAQTAYDTPLIFVALLSLFALGGAGYLAVSLVERAALRWDE